MSDDLPMHGDDAPDRATVVHEPAMLFTIASNHPSLAGHFPGNPIVPGVVLLDAVLQAIERGHGTMGALRIAQAKFVQPLLPGQPARVLLEGAAPKWRYRVLRVEAAGDVLLATGDIALSASNDAPRSSADPAPP